MEDDVKFASFMYIKCKPFLYTGDEQGFNQCVFTFLIKDELLQCVQQQKMSEEECLRTPRVFDKLLHFQKVFESPFPATPKVQSLVNKYANIKFNNTEEALAKAQEECYDDIVALEKCALFQRQDQCFRQNVSKAQCRLSIVFAKRLRECANNSTYKDDPALAIGDCVLNTTTAAVLLDVLDTAAYNKKELMQIAENPSSVSNSALAMDDATLQQKIAETKNGIGKLANDEFEQCVNNNSGLDFNCLTEKINRDLSHSIHLCGKHFKRCLSTPGRSFFDCLVEDEEFSNCTSRVQEKM